jgi:DNA-binding transcriptional MerR regulator
VLLLGAVRSPFNTLTCDVKGLSNVSGSRYGGGVEHSTGLRIGEFAQRVGVSADVLRAWERRYGLLPPRRSPGNYRLYGTEEERIVREVVSLRDRGVPIAEAVAAARSRWATDSIDEESEAAADRTEALLRAAHAGVRELDETATRQAVRDAIGALGTRRAIRDVVLPLLKRVGDDWASGRTGVEHEHLASHAVRREVGAAGVVQADPGAPVVVLACPPGELHDIVLLCIGVLLSQRGLSIRFLGADTPYSALQKACAQVRPDLVVISASRSSVLEEHAGAIRTISRSWRVAVGGRGTSERLAESLGARLLPADLDEALEDISAAVAGGRGAR